MIQKNCKTLICIKLHARKTNTLSPGKAQPVFIYSNKNIYGITNTTFKSSENVSIFMSNYYLKLIAYERCFHKKK